MQIFHPENTADASGIIGGSLSLHAAHMTVSTLPRWMAYACLALSMALVGSYVALSKPLVLVFPVFLLAWLRFGVGALAMAHWLRKPADEPPMTPRTRWLLFLESFLGNFLFSICMLYGVSLTTAVAAGVVMSSIPAVVAVLSWLFLRERIGWRSTAGIACAAIGIGLFSLQKTHSGVSADTAGPLGISKAVLGNLLVFAAVICEASYVVIGKRLTDGLGPRRISALINLVGLALVTPMGLWAALSFDFAAVQAPMWLLLVFYGLAASVWTSDLRRAHRLAERLESGIVWINTWMNRDLRTPFGGVKQSGIGREGGWEALRFFTEAKNVTIDLG